MKTAVDFLDFKLNVERRMIKEDFQMVELCEIFDQAFKMEKEQKETYKYTEFDLISAFEYGWNQRHFDKTDEDELREIQKRFIQSLQQPTEIEVEIVMEGFFGIGDKYTPNLKPKLDSEGCLILKKI
jgi:hypothetical protein